MGYVSSIKDEQSTIYANRQTADSPLIPRLHGAERVTFTDVLTNKYDQQNYFARNAAIQQRKKNVPSRGTAIQKEQVRMQKSLKAKQVENELMNKGSYMDLTI
ncbi:hypothetical protein FLK61_33720 [Paenalkalicoccus suaedae]|uniref:Uncharacterized protein n=1 Tax=Paenalkalicoccus suaedae TaxID=2592382 RepID=A0A859FHJ2_9BACI|nr:hypothetical protein [Paenalkalicoccus suaedae]QKS71646.1 hypothetical protein FLK61_33720 [Paenalkalicoccus suaedae]